MIKRDRELYTDARYAITMQFYYPNTPNQAV